MFHLPATKTFHVFFLQFLGGCRRLGAETGHVFNHAFGNPVGGFSADSAGTSSHRPSVSAAGEGIIFRWGHQTGASALVTLEVPELVEVSAAEETGGFAILHLFELAVVEVNSGIALHVVGARKESVTGRFQPPNLGVEVFDDFECASDNPVREVEVAVAGRFRLAELRARRASGNEGKMPRWECTAVVPGEDVAADIRVSLGVVVESGALVTPLFEYA